MVRLPSCRDIACAIGKFMPSVGEQVVHMHRSAVSSDRTARYRSSRSIGHFSVLISVSVRDAHAKRDRRHPSERMHGIVGLAKLAGALDDGLENRLDIGRRGGDHA